ncbi:MAG: tRNA uridine-5-carboxymethylaminomethyl(34) synthesis GTPase MnmE [Gemmatimonadetes bacterium]|nr:tRNA uridine-5-carboxymethylaminomethyl(34) synthesis GTPase MnmE [Gemmatimonadota bacterium]
MELDTIAAIATAPGPAALAVVRVSGRRAGEILNALLGQAAAPPVRAPTLRELQDPANGEVLDQAVVTWYQAPASYTGEDLVEISCHGGRLVPALVLDACLASGARMAEPGEFTRRAYLNGKLDLVQAEAVADLVDAHSRRLHRAAMGQLERGLSERVAALRAALIHVEALLAHHIDFPEEDDAPVPVESVAEEGKGVLRQLEVLLATAPEGTLLREGAVVVLAGRPNTGKSSLYNALLGEERAIVTEEPGTTRDALEAMVQMGGFPFRLVDTAGLRAAEGRVEKLGVEVARRYLARADVVLLCVDVGTGVGEAETEFLGELGSRPIVRVDTKGDLGGDALEDGEGCYAGRVRVSVVTGEGLGELRDLLPRLVFRGLVGSAPDVPVVTRRRQARALAAARDEVGAFVGALDAGVPAEMATTHLRAAETALEEVVGAVSVGEILDAVFKEFCIGK